MNWVERAKQCESVEKMRRLLFRLDKRACDARRAGWPALAYSWQKDCERVVKLIAERG